jgi:hypothetical protein
MHLNHATGRQGEFLASFILEQHGIEVHHVNRNGADLWCKLPSGKIVPIEVKTAARPILDNSKSVPRYHFNTPRRGGIDAHFYCFVALDRQLIWVRPAADITMGTLSVREIEFTPELQADSVAALLAH